MTLDQYIDNINKSYTLGNTTEQTLRGDLQRFHLSDTTNETIDYIYNTVINNRALLEYFNN